jgi:hypothetical protein
MFTRSFCAKFEIVTAVETSMLYWVLIPRCSVGRCQRFKETYCLHLQGWRPTSMFLRNAVNLPTTPHGVTTKNNIGIMFFLVIYFTTLPQYCLLLLGGVKQCIPKSCGHSWPTVRPHLSSNIPDTSTHALWLYQRHLAVTEGGGEKCPWILLT